MDSLVVSAARLLARGDPLGALKRVALRDDPPALALRGIAMAQLGEYDRARELLRSAARGFGRHERLAQARCRVAEGEIALATRDLRSAVRMLQNAAQVLDELKDPVNALHARLLAARQQLLVGDVAAAEKSLAGAKVDLSTTPPALVARAELTRAELALRRIHVEDATNAFERAHAAALAAGIPALIAEIDRAQRALSAPAARLIRAGAVELVDLKTVEELFTSDAVIVDGCRRVVRCRRRAVSLAGRPVLFELVSALAEAWPADVPRDLLIRRAFAARVANESHRARLRVELGRLRAVLRTLLRIEATPSGFVLAPANAAAIAVLAPPIGGPSGSILALLEGGEAWSTSALAHALGAGQRTVQRALTQLEQSGAVRAMGGGRSRRWLAPPLAGFATTLLLPGALASG